MRWLRRRLVQRWPYAFGMVVCLTAAAGLAIGSGIEASTLVLVGCAIGFGALAFT